VILADGWSRNGVPLRISIDEFCRTSEVLVEIPNLTEQENELLQEMLTKVSAKLLHG
jgi:hypothetical protein